VPVNYQTPIEFFMKLSLSLLLLLSIAIRVSGSNISELRMLYYKAAKDKSAADRLLYITENFSNKSQPIILGYKGMAYMLHANYVTNPYLKWSYFRKGRVLLELAITNDSSNVEIRFLRFCAQTNSPFFLGYHREISNDKTFILVALNQLTDIDLKRKIKKYLMASDF
jgi:hypothetical protein